MQNFEKLGVFYLGKQYDPATKSIREDTLLYDSKDLTTHAVCLGMTGSGKTGLCLSMLEEAAIDGIPAIAIDPKGDLGNLLLTFPNLKPKDFEPWVNTSEATRKGLTPEQYASEVSELWRNGLAMWGEDGDRIQRYRDAVDISIYTPGSQAGLPMTVLQSFAAPPAALQQDADAYRERILSSVSGLLALLGLNPDPIRSRDHILLANIFDNAWKSGRNLEMATLIREIQSPGFQKVGFIDLESFYPSSERFELAMRLNNLLASPGFTAWMQGEPLNIQRLYYTSTGQPRLSIISIAHLSESERMFFVTILLNEIVSWMRAQAGTTSLRALLYMDEVFGYFPPTANPPSKKPLLTLMKQARAYGLGVVLATQNPVDLDYKGLSNAGTWFLGRLQTERDKARVLDGLEGASAATGTKFDRQQMETLLSGLDSRVFLMNNVHDDEPILFHTRWALSYLSGPMTRNQIETLMSKKKQKSTASQAAAPASDAESTAAQPGTKQPLLKEGTGSGRPMLPPEIPERFLTMKKPLAAGDRLVYRPAILGEAKLHFSKASAKVDLWQDVFMLSPVDAEQENVVWEQAEQLEDQANLDNEPAQDAEYGDLTAASTQKKNYSRWKTDLKNHLYQHQALVLYKSADPKAISSPEEQEGDFRARLVQMQHELRDVAIEKMRQKYNPKLSRIQERIVTAKQRVEKEKAQVTEKSYSTMLSIGQTLLGAMFGRKLASRTNVTRAASSMRSAGRISKEKADVEHAEEKLELQQQKLEDLQAEFDEELAGLKQPVDPTEFELEEVVIRPRKSDLLVENVLLIWCPWSVDHAGIAERLF